MDEMTLSTLLGMGEPQKATRRDLMDNNVVYLDVFAVEALDVCFRVEEIGTEAALLGKQRCW